MQLATLQQYIADRLEDVLPEPNRRVPPRNRYILDGGEVCERLASLDTKRAIVHGLQGALIRMRWARDAVARREFTTIDGGEVGRVPMAWSRMLSYDGHPLDLTCPQCQLNGTAWFSPDDTFRLKIDQIPEGFRLIDQPQEAIGPLFCCLQCDIEATPL